MLALFPGQESVRFLPSAWLDNCADESALSDELWNDCAPGPVRMAIDIGGGVGADRSCIVVRNDKQLLEVFASSEHGVLDEARYRLEPEVVRLVHKWQVPGQYVTYDRSGIGRSFGSYLERHGLFGAIGYYGGGRGGRYYVNRRSANAHALKRRLDPKSSDWVPFYCGGCPLWPEMRSELAAMHEGDMDEDDGYVRQSVETKESLMARLHGKSPDLADALIQSFTHRGD